MGDLEDPLAGLVTFPVEPDRPPLEIIVGKGYAARIALETAQENPQLGCPVVSPLGLALLKLYAGSVRDLNDLLALDEAQHVLTGWRLQDAVEPHLQRLPADARHAWARLQTLQGPALRTTWGRGDP